MANSIHSLRISFNEDNPRNASAFPSTAAPSGYALFPDKSVPAQAPPPEFALIAGAKPLSARARSRRALYAGIAAAVALHLAFLLPFLFRPAPSLHELGVEEGLPDHLNVSVISEADLKRLSSDPFRQEAPPTPSQEIQPIPGEAQPVPPSPQPAEQEVTEASPPQPNKSEKTQTAFDPSGFAVMASEQFGSQIKQAFQAAEAKQQTRRAVQAGGNLRLLRPGASHSGKSDEFERAVIWALAATKPLGNGKWGTTIVTFLISAAGKVEDLRLLKTSGDNWLDQGALLAVRQARMPIPPDGLTQGDRRFNVEYISLPER